MHHKNLFKYQVQYHNDIETIRDKRLSYSMKYSGNGKTSFIIGIYV